MWTQLLPYLWPTGEILLLKLSTENVNAAILSKSDFPKIRQVQNGIFIFGNVFVSQFGSIRYR
jgi:hypothetical protein